MPNERRRLRARVEPHLGNALRRQPFEKLFTNLRGDIDGCHVDHPRKLEHGGVRALPFHLVVLDSFFLGGGETSGWLQSYYDLLNDSVIVAYFREVLIPAAGFLARPFVPTEIADLLVP